MSILFSPLTIKNITFKNRIVISPMCEYSSMDGFANDWHLVHLGSRAVGGAALVIQEATAVSPEGRISPDDMGLWKDGHIEKLRTITSFIKQQGAGVGIQLAHAGRKASSASPWKGGKQIKIQDGGWKSFAPSAIPFHDNDEAPHALDKEGIEKVIKDFTRAAQRAIQAGYQVLEIHAAHGYLLNEFLSPLTNHRLDEYGGSFENRIRLLLRVIEGIQTVWSKESPLFVRISATDWAEGGWNIDESVRLSVILKSKGVDLVDCSSGGAVSGIKIVLTAGYQVPFAERIKKETGMLTGAVGLITEARQAEEIIAGGRADLIFIARQSLRDPYFPLHAAKELGAVIQWPSQYERAKI
ncbi:MAG: NADH:flavin oxidoreductase/NADH oxidase [Chitinophagaceae bacterium]|nr:NADH:flavin oxidoreductase/NADH oxidase [Chitinophagaceae bacterium]